MRCDACGTEPPSRSLECVDQPRLAQLCGGCFSSVALFVADTRSELDRLPGRPKTQLWRDRGAPGRYYLFRNRRIGPPDGSAKGAGR